MSEVQTAVIDYSGNKNRKERIAQEEEELNKLIEEQRGAESKGEIERAPQKETVDQEDEEVGDGPEPSTAEEKVWKKRHGDLRRHTQKQINELTEKIETLTRKLEQEKTNPSVSQEKLNEVAERNPVVMALIENRAKEIAEKMLGDTNEKFESITKREQELLQEKNENKIRKQHEDYDQIVASDEFHEWAGGQEWLQGIVYDDEYYKRPDAIVKVLNLYKMENGLTTTAQKESRKSALQSVDVKSKSEPSAKERGKMRESYFASDEYRKLPIGEQEKMLDKWNEAVREGNVIRDL